MTTEPLTLLECFEKLTRPHTTRVLQQNDAGISCVSEVEHDPLLVQLRDAVAGGISEHAGVTEARAKIPINPAAMELFAAIAKQINAWYLTLPNIREDRYIYERLADWYTDYTNRVRAGRVSDVTEHDTLRTLRGWVSSIESTFDPVKVLELTEEHREVIRVPKTRVRVVNGERVKETVTDEDGNPVMIPKLTKDKKIQWRVVKIEPAACPHCGERYAFDPKTGDKMSALIIEYRSIGEETLDKTTGLCRFCDAVWKGRTAVRELRWALGQAEDTPTG